MLKCKFHTGDLKISGKDVFAVLYYQMDRSVTFRRKRLTLDHNFFLFFRSTTIAPMDITKTSEKKNSSTNNSIMNSSSKYTGSFDEKDKFTTSMSTNEMYCLVLLPGQNENCPDENENWLG